MSPTNFLYPQVQHFITLMDYLELKRRDVHELFPALRDLSESLGKVNTLPADYQGKVQVLKWCVPSSPLITDFCAHFFLFPLFEQDVQAESDGWKCPN